jgi:hypothetical protein
MPTPARPRITAADRERRRVRIFARLQEGWSYEALAEAETLSRERVRQIVKASLDRREVDPNADFVRLQMARLDPALRLASEKVAGGDLKAIDRLLRVLDRMDKYQSAAASVVEEECEEEGGDEAESFLEDEAAEQKPLETVAEQRERARRWAFDRLDGLTPAMSARLDALMEEKRAKAKQEEETKLL